MNMHNNVSRFSVRCLTAVAAIGVAWLALPTSVAAQSGPDLAVSLTATNTSPTEAGSFALYATVSNDGDGESAATTLRYYQSTDATISSADMEVGTDAVGALAAGGTSPGGSPGGNFVVLRAPSPAGTYYYGACVDAVTGESDTTNNCSGSVRVEVEAATTFPDLQVGQPTVTDSRQVAGGLFRLATTVTNVGDRGSGATTLRYYQSTDATISSADTQVGTDGIRSLGGTASVSTDVTAPLTAGTYYYGACVDAVPLESDTTNNCSPSVEVEVVEATTSPELQVSHPTVTDSTTVAGGSFTLSATVSNAGDGASPATTLRYYLRNYELTDGTISNPNSQVGTDEVGTLAATETSAESISLTARSTAGSYYYGVCVDAVPLESDTTNNCSGSVRVEVEEAPAFPDLAVGSPTVTDSTPVEGGKFTLSVTVRNDGNEESAATTLRYYRSRNATNTFAGTQIGDVGFGVLLAHEARDESIRLAAPLTAGTYYYEACVDRVAGESDTTNNCSGSVLVEVEEAPTLNVSGGSADEGDAVNFAVTLSVASDQQVTVSYTTSSGTATSGTDFTATNGTLTFAANETSKTVSVSTADDASDEENETFMLTLSSPTNAKLGDDTATGTIRDNDAPPMVRAFDASAPEGGTVEFTLSLSAPSGKQVTVQYETSSSTAQSGLRAGAQRTTTSGTAESGTDFTPESGTVIFAPGETSKTVSVQTVDDAEDEENETLTLTLSSATNATLAPGSTTATGTIADDDGASTLSVSDASATEGDSLNFSVSLLPASGQQVTVRYATTSGTAESGTDFTAVSGTLTFAAGETSQTVRVQTNEDRNNEGNETFTLALSNATNATLDTDASATGTIFDGVTPVPALPTVGVGVLSLLFGACGAWLAAGGSRRRRDRAH